jgi:O-antigen ligase
MLMNTGTTSNKNVFGVILLVVSLYTLWRVMGLWREKNATDRRRHMIAQIVLLLFGLLLFRMADSATSLGCFVFGGGFIFIANRRAIKKRPVRLHVLCFVSVVVAGFIFFFGGEGIVAKALGRQSNLSGRTDIWAAVIPAAPNALVGAGYESFWISPNVVKFQQGLVGWWHPEYLNEAHNGYIEVYLNLGWVGVCLISCILISGYSRGVAAFRRNPSVGGLMLAYIIISSVYSITEAGFRSPDPMWIFLVLAIVSSTAISSGVVWDPVTRKSATGPSRYTAKRRVQVAAGV